MYTEIQIYGANYDFPRMRFVVDFNGILVHGVGFSAIIVCDMKDAGTGGQDDSVLRVAIISSG